MSKDAPLFAGFDLGTTNSAAAVFDGDQITVIRSSQGGSLTPSVVRIDAGGRVSVGGRALRFLDRDPNNTHAEFKRLMGTGQMLSFPDAGLEKRPEELAAQVLTSLRSDMRDQLGVAPERAVISVPALFELPQNSATSEAARLAGFEQVELLQEPIASALATGWTADEAGGAWLVYDLGGGTFDVSLLETRDGLLRVVGHDGDNFLGGRDFDLAVVDWVIEQLANNGDATLDRGNPAHAGVLRTLKRAAEEAKIELSRGMEAMISVLDHEVDGQEFSIELALDRATLERLCSRLIEKSLTVCERLLGQHGLEPSQLGTIVLVGGPTVMPFLRDRVTEHLGVPIAEGHDPMTLVAKGASIYAATAGLDGRPVTTKTTNKGHRLWMQYPPVSSDLTPHVVGRVLEGGPGARPVKLRFVRDDGEWTSPDLTIDVEGAFVGMASLATRCSNRFTIEAFAKDGSAVVVSPAHITIVQGLTISDPPLSRSIGVALANDAVRIYFERGAPLPARRTFTHHTVEGIAKGSEQSVLKIPLVQGEFEQAHLCRLVGSLQISGADLNDSLPIDSTIEVTLEIDRGGRMNARALIPALDQTFDGVAHLLVPDADPEVLEANMTEMLVRITDLRTDAFRHGWTDVIERLSGAEAELASVEKDITAARGGDSDAGQKARRTMLEVDATLVESELEGRWPELEEKARDDITWAAEWVARYGSDNERSLLDEVTEAVRMAREDRNVGELQRQLRLARRLGTAALYRHPEAWEWMFESAVADIDMSTDLPRAKKFADEGRAAIAASDTPALRRAVEGLWRLLPSDRQARSLSFDSGIR